VRIAVDDFGTGYSSLGYLRQFPVDILKIARDFVVAPDRSDSDWAFAHAIVALGRTLGLRIVAEGIEEAGQVDRLLELGCSIGQGFYFSWPMPAAELAASLGLPPAPSPAVPGSGVGRPGFVPVARAGAWEAST
jgi:EAL domain-containing protein (putative c-di-GMP-specific phosphodiesterase class I)